MWRWTLSKVNDRTVSIFQPCTFRLFLSQIAHFEFDCQILRRYLPALPPPSPFPLKVKLRKRCGIRPTTAPHLQSRKRQKKRTWQELVLLGFCCISGNLLPLLYFGPQPTRQEELFGHHPVCFCICLFPVHTFVFVYFLFCIFCIGKGSRTQGRARPGQDDGQWGEGEPITQSQPVGKGAPAPTAAAADSSKTAAEVKARNWEKIERSQSWWGWQNRWGVR